jgi:hypothetical protein
MTNKEVLRQFQCIYGSILEYSNGIVKYLNGI